MFRVGLDLGRSPEPGCPSQPRAHCALLLECPCHHHCCVSAVVPASHRAHTHRAFVSAQLRRVSPVPWPPGALLRAPMQLYYWAMHPRTLCPCTAQVVPLSQLPRALLLAAMHHPQPPCTTTGRWVLRLLSVSAQHGPLRRAAAQPTAACRSTLDLAHVMRQSHGLQIWAEVFLWFCVSLACRVS